jgi:hypothetical protein
MNQEYKLQIFISYSGKRRDVWEPLVQLIEKMYQCEIIWGQDEAAKYQDPDSLMEDMVKRSDVAIFLLTNDSEGICRELKLWYRHNSNQFVNALLLKDPLVFPKNIKAQTGFNAPYISLSSDNPWADIHYVFPAINELIKQGLLSAKRPSWLRSYNKIIHKYNWKVSPESVPLNRIKSLFKVISENARYGDPEKWSFRINWHIGSPELDSYSDSNNCLSLLEALLQTAAIREEYEFIFGAIERVVANNLEPPRKLSGNIIFSGCSISTLKEAQDILGNHPYEKDTGFSRKRAKHAEQVPDQPEALLLPKEKLTYNDNYQSFVDSQRLILKAVSNICKYVLCSTVEVTASHSFLLSEDGSDGSLAMSCTATRTNKESLSAISEVPVVIEENGKLVWFGQLYKKPSSEYRPHWIYHNRNGSKRVRKNLLLHFHPSDLVDTYRKVHEGKSVYTKREEFIDETSCFFIGRKVDFHVYQDYERFSSRDPEFGVFMRDNIEDDTRDYSVIWKPNHGLWVFLDDRNCSDETLVEILLTLDKFSRKAAE